jgi:hypothetical protein
MEGASNGGASSNFLFTNKYSVDIQVAAGEEVRLLHSFGLGGGTSFTVIGYLAGYLISE